MPGNVETIILRILGDSKGGEQALNSMQKSLIKFGASLTATSAAALVTFAKLGEGGARIEALEGKFARMAAAFGKSADEMLAEWRRAASGTIDDATLMQKANQAALLGLPVDRLADMLQVARNAAAATGESVEYMFNSIVVGVARQSKPILDNLGIIVAADEAYAAYAKTQGKVVEALTANERQLAFLDATMAASVRQAQILGDVTETNSTKIARGKTAWTNLKDAISKLFIPVAVKAAEIMSSIERIFAAIPEPIKQFIANLLALAAGFGMVLGPLAAIKGALPLIKMALAAAGVSASGLVSALLPLVIVIGVLAAAGSLIAKVWKEDWAGIRTVVMQLVETVQVFLKPIVDDIKFWFGQIKQDLLALMEVVQSMLEPLLARLRTWLASLNVADFMRTFGDAVNVILSTVHNLLQALQALMEGRADDAMMPLADAGLNAVTMLVIVWRKYISKAVTWGWNLIVNFANGIIRAAKSVLSSAATFVGNVIGRFFKPGSPPKEGPLRGIVQWGKGLIDTYLRAFGLADFGILNDVLGPMRQALDTAVSLGDIDQGDMLKVFGQVRQETAALIANFRKTGEISEEALGSIARQLGEGGREYTEYLRLTLQHQKALESLKNVQAEVAEAEKKGFVPADLKAKLAAAQEEADAAKEKMDWQKAYLEALQEGADLQREMVDAMKELTEAMKGEAGGEGAAVEPMDAGAALPLDTGGPVTFAGFGGFSAEFEGVKAEVEAFFKNLPVRMAEFGLSAITYLQTLWAQIKLIVAVKGLELIESIKGTWAMFKTVVAIKGLEIITYLLTMGRQLNTIVATKGLELIESIKGTWAMLKLVIAIKGLELLATVNGIWSNIKLAASLKWIEIKNAVLLWVAQIGLDLLGKVEEFKSWGSGLLQGFWDGLKSKWAEVKAWFDTNLGGLITGVKDLFGMNSPSTVFADIGRNLVAGLELGFDLTGFQRSVQAQVAGVSVNAMAGVAAGSGGVNVYTGPWQFPSVRDGRDAGGFERQVQRMADDATLRGRLPGGNM